MTDLALPSMNRAQGSYEHAVPPVHDDWLQLPESNAPQTVFVSLVPLPGGVTPAFSHTATSPRFTKGIAWSPPPTEPDYALFLHLHLLDGVPEITCAALWYSVPHDGKQLMCIRVGKAGYSFYVDVPGKNPIDPEIIITPIPTR
jgi:hypothetical protein